MKDKLKKYWARNRESIIDAAFLILVIGGLLDLLEVAIGHLFGSLPRLLMWILQTGAVVIGLFIWRLIVDFLDDQRQINNFKRRQSGKQQEENSNDTR